MRQITTHKTKKTTKASSLSSSKGTTKIIKEKMSSEWSQDIVDLAGSWGDDFPSLQEIRTNYTTDLEWEYL